MSQFELPPLPEPFEPTRSSLHRVAEDVIKVAREHVTGEFSLIRTPGGFGTPQWDRGNQIRVEGTELVVVDDGAERRGQIVSLAAAAELIGADWLPGGFEADDAPLAVDSAAAAALADAYAVGEAALERIRDSCGPVDEPTEPTLWPEHFDIAIEMGPEDAGLRANYGLSPGDENHPAPYFYVGPWEAPPQGELWNGSGFTGAELGYAELAGAADPVSTAVEFSLERKRALEQTKGDE